MSQIFRIDAEKLKRMQMLHVKFLLFDLRPLADYEKGHISSAFHVDRSLFIKQLLKSVLGKETPIVVYNEDGEEMEVLVEEAESHGFQNIVILEGGYKNFKAAE